MSRECAGYRIPESLWARDRYREPRKVGSLELSPTVITSELRSTFQFSDGSFHTDRVLDIKRANILLIESLILNIVPQFL